MSQTLAAPLVPRRAPAMGLLLLAVMLWGAVPIGNRYFLGANQLDIPGAAYMALRYLIAATCFLPGLPGALRSWRRQDWVRGAVCGLCGVTLYNMLAGMAGHSVSAGMIGLLNASEPLMIVGLSHAVAQRLPRGRTLVAAGIGLGGIALLASGAGPAQGDTRGILLLLGSAAGWAVYCVLVPPLLKSYGAVQVSAVTMSLGTLPLLAAGATQVAPVVAMLDGTQWEMLISVALGGSVVALLAWNKGAAVLGAEASGWFLYLIPVFSVAGGCLLLGERVNLAELAGGGLILASVYLAQNKRPLFIKSGTKNF